MDVSGGEGRKGRQYFYSMEGDGKVVRRKVG